MKSGQHIHIQQLAQTGQLQRKFMHGLGGAQLMGAFAVFAVLGITLTVLAGAVAQFDAGLVLQRLQGSIQRVADEEIFAGLAQLRGAQAQRIEHALERLYGLRYRVPRGKLALRNIGAALRFAPALTHQTQFSHDVGNGKVTHDVVLF